jgi:formylglycine-generating enzyme required for sulfatase activity
VYPATDHALGREVAVKVLQDRSWPVGQKRPNDLGLFDMHGSVWTWCQEGLRPYPLSGVQVRPASDEEDNRVVDIDSFRVVRGGWYHIHSAEVRAAYRNGDKPTRRIHTMGLRVARTCD